MRVWNGSTFAAWAPQHIQTSRQDQPMKTIQPIGHTSLMHKIRLSALLVNLGHTVVGAVIIAFLSGRNGSSM